MTTRYTVLNNKAKTEELLKPEKEKHYTFNYSLEIPENGEGPETTNMYVCYSLYGNTRHYHMSIKCLGE